MKAKTKRLFGLAMLLALTAGCQTLGGDGDTGRDAEATQNTTAAASSRTAPGRSDKRPHATLIARYAAANNVPVDLAHAVVFSESSYRANARGAAGEIGLMQLRLSTARGLGYTGSAAGLYDPATNIKYGMKYLGGAHRLADGSVCGTVLRYNAGHAARRMNPVSQRYCNKVSRLLAR